MSEFFVVAENAKFKVEVEKFGPDLSMRPVGILNEDVDFGAVLDFLKDHRSAGTLSIDMGKVQGINSCGVREWIMFIERAQSLMTTRFEMVNELFVEQASIVPNLLGEKGTEVVAFAAPYFCSKCNKRYTQILKTSQIKVQDNQYGVPSYKCGKCGELLEFDALEEEYFHFLRHSQDAA